MKKLIRRMLAAGVIIALLTAPGTAGTWTHHQRNKDTAHEIAELMRARGYAEDHPVILACQEWWQAENDLIENVVTKFTTKEQRWEYPEASYAWQLLKEAGLSDVCAAAILGSAMAESGGQTLNIDFYQDVDGYWGAWAMSKVYYPDVVGKGADAQVAKILETLDERMSAGGGAKRFFAMTDVRQAAKFFSDYWERPMYWAEKRADDAEIAYRYFVGE